MAHKYLGGDPSNEANYEYIEGTEKTKPWEKYKVEADRTWTEAGLEGVGNLPMSIYGVAEDVVTAIANPVETGKAILNLASGLMQKALPESVNKRLGFDPNNEELANQVFQFYADKYGSEQAIKKAIAEDPASIIADLSTFLTGTGGIITGTGKLAKMSKLPGAQKTIDIGKKTMTAGTKTDPISLTAAGTVGTLNLAGKGAEQIAGIASGVGTAPLEEARLTGQSSPFGKPKSEKQKIFEENIKGKANFEDILINAKKGIENMRRERMQAYRKNQDRLKQDRTELNFTSIDDSLNDAKKFAQFEGKTINANAQEVLDKIKGIVDNWKRQEAGTFHTPEGFDALKQEIASVIEKIPFEQSKARAVGSQIYNSVKNTIGKQAPMYEKMMKNYQEALRLEKEIEKALSLGNKAAAETAIRKLQSIMRNDVNTGYGSRTEYVKQLEKASGENIMPAIAGQTLNPIAPRGISRMSALPTIGGAGLFDPYAAIPAAAMSSPRIMGTAENVLGRLQGTMKNLRQKIPVSNQGITGLLNLSYQLEQQRQRDEQFNQQMNMQP